MIFPLGIKIHIKYRSCVSIFYLFSFLFRQYALHRLCLYYVAAFCLFHFQFSGRFFHLIRFFAGITGIDIVLSWLAFDVAEQRDWLAVVSFLHTHIFRPLYQARNLYRELQSLRKLLPEFNWKKILRMSDNCMDLSVIL